MTNKEERKELISELVNLFEELHFRFNEGGEKRSFIRKSKKLDEKELQLFDDVFKQSISENELAKALGQTDLQKELMADAVVNLCTELEKSKNQLFLTLAVDVFNNPNTVKKLHDNFFGFWQEAIVKNKNPLRHKLARFGIVQNLIMTALKRRMGLTSKKLCQIT